MRLTYADAFRELAPVPRYYISEFGCRFLLSWIDRWKRHVRERFPDAHTRQLNDALAHHTVARSGNVDGSSATIITTTDEAETTHAAGDKDRSGGDMVETTEKSPESETAANDDEERRARDVPLAAPPLEPDNGEPATSTAGSSGADGAFLGGAESLNASHGSAGEDRLRWNPGTERASARAERARPLKHSPRAWEAQGAHTPPSASSTGHVPSPIAEAASSVPMEVSSAAVAPSPTTTVDMSCATDVAVRHDHQEAHSFTPTEARELGLPMTPVYASDAPGILSTRDDSGVPRGGPPGAAPIPLLDPWTDDGEDDDEEERDRDMSPAPLVKDVRVTFPVAKALPPRAPIDHGANHVTTVVRPRLATEPSGDAPSKEKDDIARLKRENNKFRRVMTLAHKLYARQRFTELGNVLSTYNIGPSQPGHGNGVVPDAGSSGPNVIRIGDRVVVGRARRLDGVIKYFGPTAFAPGDWVGIELDADEGKNSGEVNGIRYFHSRRGRGVFVKAAMLRPDAEATASV